MSAFTAAKLQPAYIQWIKSLNVKSAVAVTLTFKRCRGGRSISEKAAGDAIRMFGRMLQTAACGMRFRRGEDCISFIAVKEGGHQLGDKHLHYHAFVEVPDGWSRDDWIRLIEKKIRKIEDFGSENCFITPLVDGGWVEYMFKRSDKTCYADALDVISLWTKSRST
jgi:hypothetical protein